MKSNDRRPLQVGLLFKKELEEIQAQYLLKRGKRISLSEVTNKIAESPKFDILKKDIIKETNMRNQLFRMDKRK